MNFKRDIPVIMLTGVVDVEMAIKILRNGAFDYLIKPVKRSELLLTVERALSHRNLVLEKKSLELENIMYQRSLEEKVEERTIALRKALDNLERIHFDTVQILATAIEEKEPYLQGHSNRVRLMSSRLAMIWGFSADQIKTLEFAALLHDIGKIAIPELVLNKPDALSKDEKDINRRHPIIGARIVSQVDYFQDIALVIRWHHERWDGKGYPDGLSGEHIPVAARMICVVDAFDAMTSNRPYRSALTIQMANDILREEAGKQFDAEMVGLFITHDVHKQTWKR
jgi:putative two-component system response regulator